jgi:hypothetical protein
VSAAPHTEGRSRTVSLTLPLPLNLANSRMHWAAKLKAMHAWKTKAIISEPKLRGRHTPMQRATLEAVFYVGRWVMDDDNVTARMKWIGDILKERGLIVDDKRPHLTLTGIPAQRTETPRRVELTLTEVAG